MDLFTRIVEVEYTTTDVVAALPRVLIFLAVSIGFFIFTNVITWLFESLLLLKYRYKVYIRLSNRRYYPYLFHGENFFAVSFIPFTFL